MKTEKRPLIWTDDDAIPEGFMLDDDIGDWLFIAPKQYTGLSNKHLDLISKFIDGCSGI